MIKIYTLSTCGHCKAVKQFLNERNIPFEFIDVDLLTGEERRQTVEEVKRLNAACTFPTICIDDNIIVGFSAQELTRILGLDQ